MRLPSVGGGRVLDFDIENRPLSYWMADRPTAEITAIASCWVGEPDSMEVSVLTRDMDSPRPVLEAFLRRYNEADIVTGHYITRHDLPIINGALMELGMPLLSSKLTCDTKVHMMKKADVPATQEYLLEVLDIRNIYGERFEKFHMTQHMWRDANRLTAPGIRATVERVTSDVFAHMALRERMLELGMLRPPKMWNPGGGFSEVTEGRHR